MIHLFSSLWIFMFSSAATSLWKIGFWFFFQPLIMWKAAAGYSVKPGAPQNNDDDDWETEADFVVCTSNILL